MTTWAMFTSAALFWVWETRQHRWTLFFGALQGKYSLPRPA